MIAHYFSTMLKYVKHSTTVYNESIEVKKSGAKSFTRFQ